MMPPRFPFVLAAIVAVGLTAASCRKLDERMEITESREVSAYASPTKAIVSSADRFYEKAAKEEQAPEVPKENPLNWTTPAGWSEAPPSSTPGAMRLIDLRFGEKLEGECYLSAMPGKAGGLEANVNRWRTQMGLPAFTPEELQKLPAKKFLNRDSTFVTFDGDFKAVGAPEAAKGYRLLGVVQVAPEFTLFVKMTGPKETVEKNVAAFDQFCQSISIKH